MFPRVLMIGIGGVYNYGCEAIVRGTVHAILQKYPEAILVYGSNRVSDDRNRLEDVRIKVIENKKLNRYSIKKLWRKLLSLIGVFWSPRVDSLDALKDIDIVLSIGGDIYTLNSTGGYSLSLPKFGEASQKLGIPYILWGASVGPFSSNPKAEQVFSKYLKEHSLIAAREKSTVEYLETLGVVDNVVACADPAFLVAPEIRAQPGSGRRHFTIGINLSPLSSRYSGISEEEAIRIQAGTIEWLISEFDALIVLIPHVVCNFDESDDDQRYLQKVEEAIRSVDRHNVTLVTSDPGFVGIKKELILCDLVLAARMHCAISALTANVPTIFVSYSRKARAMCEYVYGNQGWTLSLSDFGNQKILGIMVKAMKNQEAEIREFLSERIPEIQSEAYRPLQNLDDLLDKNSQ